MKQRIARLIGALLLVSGTIRAQEAAPISTGPPPGTAATPAMAYAPVGPRAGEEFDPAAAIGDRPGALLFIHELTRNGLPIIRGLDQIGAEFALLGFKSHTFMLSDDRTAAETKLKAVNGSLKLRSPIVLSLDGMDGPGNYALNRKAILSLIMLKDGKIQKSIAFTDVNAKDAKLVRKLIEDVAGTFPNDPAALRELAESRIPNDPGALRRLAVNQTVELQMLRAEIARLRERASGYDMQPRRPGTPAMRGESPNPTPGSGRMAPREQPKGKSKRPPLENPGAPPVVPREGKPPEDSELNGLLRAFIRKDADKESVGRIFTDIRARAGVNESLNAETVDMLRLMLSFRDRYGIPEAQALAESFLKEHGTARNDSKQSKP